MGYKFNPLLFSGLDLVNPPGGVPVVPTSGSLPASGTEGQLYVVQDTGDVYEWRNTPTPHWEIVAGPDVMLGVGPFDSATPSADGAVDQNNQLIMQSASTTNPGLVNNTAQSLSGKKTFQDGMDANSNTITSVADPVNPQDAMTLNYADNTYIPLSQKGQPNGVASLDGAGKVPYAQLPNAIMTYKGVWDPTTNTPTLANGVGQAGDVYRASVDGASTAPVVDNWFAGDFIIYDGVNWQRSPLADGVISVNGKNSIVTLNAIDIPYDNSTSGLVATDVQDAIDAAAAAGANKTLSNLTSPTAVNQDLNLGTYDVQNAGHVSIGATSTAAKLTVDNSISEAAIPAIRMEISNALGHGFDFMHDTNNTGDLFINRRVAGNAFEAFRIARGDGAITVQNQIHNVTDPTSAQDAATKHYVDIHTVTPSGVNGAIQLSDGSGHLIDDNANLHFDLSSKQLTISPSTNGTVMNIGNAAYISGFGGDGFLGAGATVNTLGQWFATKNGASTTYCQQDGTMTIFNDSGLTPGVQFNPTPRVQISPAGVLKVLTNSLDMLNHTIINVQDPTSAQQAATKNYVDTALAAIDLSAYFKKDGSVLATGNFDLNNHQLLNVSTMSSPAGQDLILNASSIAPLSVLNSTVTSTTTGGSQNIYSLPTATFSGVRYGYIATSTGNPIIQVVDLTNNTIVQEFNTGLPSFYGFGGIAVSVFANMLYLDDSNGHNKAAFHINPVNGQLTSSASPSLGWTGSEGGMTISADGKIFIFSGNAGTESFTIDSSGNLTIVSSQSGSNFGSTPVISPSGTWVLTGTAGVTGQIMSLNPTSGVLGSPTNVTNLSKFAISPDGKFIYDASGHIFSLNETTGAVVDTGNTITTVNLNNNHCGTPLAITPDGSTLITFDNTGVVSSYSLDTTTGIATLVSASLISTGNTGIASIPGSIAVSNKSILIPSGYSNHSSPPTKLYVFQAAASKTVKVNSLRIADGSEGTPGYVWTSTDADGNGSWQPSGGGGGGANQYLSNLLSPTAINQDLLFDTGSQASIRTIDDPAGSQNLILGSGDANGGAGQSGITQLSTGASSNQSGDIYIQTGTAAGGQTGQVLINTGDAAANDIPSGAMTLRTGTTVGTADSGALSLITGTTNGASSGAINLNTGDAPTSGTVSGDISVISGTSLNGGSGAVHIFSGADSGNGATGIIELNTGNSDTGMTGDISLVTGSLLTSGASTGNVNLFTGSNPDGVSGFIQIQTGNSTNQITGQIELKTGTGGLNTESGQIHLFTGDAEAASGGISLATGQNINPANGAPTGGVSIGTGTSLGLAGSGAVNIYTGGQANAQPSGTISLVTGDSDGGSGSLFLQTGNATATGIAGDVNIISGGSENGNSGSISLNTQAPTGTGTRGNIIFSDGSEGTAGYVWTSTDTNGRGAWMPASGGATWLKQIFTLSGTDISNGYIDLSHVALTDSIDLLVKGDGIQIEDAAEDYTVNYTGGAGGNTRITWVNTLASSLVSGDKLVVKYQY